MMQSSANVTDLTKNQLNSDFILKLRKVYWTESYCLRYLPFVVGKLGANSLLTLLDSHLPIIKSRRIFMENIFSELNVKAGGVPCPIFKKLIGKAGNIVYHIKSRDSNYAPELIEVLLEISIYRGHLYNWLHQAFETMDKPLISEALSMCLLQEDGFFYGLLRIKEPREIKYEDRTLLSVLPAEPLNN